MATDDNVGSSGGLGSNLSSGASAEEWDEVEASVAALLQKVGVVFHGLSRYPYDLQEGSMAHRLATMGDPNLEGKTVEDIIMEEYRRTTELGIELLDDIDRVQERAFALAKGSGKGTFGGMSEEEIADALAGSSDKDEGVSEDVDPVRLYKAASREGFSRLLLRFTEPLREAAKLAAGAKSAKKRKRNENEEDGEAEEEADDKLSRAGMARFKRAAEKLEGVRQAVVDVVEREGIV